MTRGRATPADLALSAQGGLVLRARVAPSISDRLVGISCRPLPSAIADPRQELGWTSGSRPRSPRVKSWAIYRDRPREQAGRPGTGPGRPPGIPCLAWARLRHRSRFWQQEKALGAPSGHLANGSSRPWTRALARPREYRSLLCWSIPAVRVVLDVPCYIAQVAEPLLASAPGCASAAGVRRPR